MNKYSTLPVVSEAFSLCDIRAAICIMNNFTTAHLQPHKQACKHHEDQTHVSVTVYYMLVAPFSVYVHAACHCETVSCSFLHPIRPSEYCYSGGN